MKIDMYPEWRRIYKMAWDKEEIYDLLHEEKELMQLRDKDLSKIFHQPMYTNTWQYQLDLCRMKIKRLKNEYRINYGEDFIPGQ